MRNRNLLLACMGALVFWSCAEGRLALRLDSPKAAVLQFSCTLGEKTLNFIRNLSGNPTLAIDSRSIEESLRALPGVERVSLKNISPNALEGALQINDISLFLRRIPMGTVSFVSPTEGSLELQLSRNNRDALLALFTSNVRDYLDALMAPVVTGEKLSRKEYLALVESVYGASLRREIEQSRLRITCTVPGTIAAIEGGTSEGKVGSFSLPVIDFLVLEQPIVLKISWK
ncbi:MAG: hypothetical protein N2Z76_02200 [Treponemataceae bacterium]|nr:hypothetical protein [Treponemataceae bacterium]